METEGQGGRGGGGKGQWEAGAGVKEIRSQLGKARMHAQPGPSLGVEATEPQALAWQPFGNTKSQCWSPRIMPHSPELMLLSFANIGIK